MGVSWGGAKTQLGDFATNLGEVFMPSVTSQKAGFQELCLFAHALTDKQ